MTAELAETHLVEMYQATRQLQWENQGVAPTMTDSDSELQADA
jgi:hypothetical protein